METDEVNEDLRRAVETALGDAAIKDNDEVTREKTCRVRWQCVNFQDDVDMDDEAMLRLDPMIADAFRSQLKKSSNLKFINEKLHHQERRTNAFRSRTSSTRQRTIESIGMSSSF
jgi:hypothetical protein